MIHLLNHDTVSAAKLAERFEVSKRTILRDIEQISLARVPIKSLPGANGGYSIMEGFKLDERLISKENQTSIITALKGFLSAYDNKRYNEVLEKVQSISRNQQSQHVFFDFGVTGENEKIQEKLKILEKSIYDKTEVEISYVNAWGGASNRIIEPIALYYRWYAWYLLAYCQTKQDYRIFKLARILDLETTRIPFAKEHGDPAPLMEQAFQGVGRREMVITLLCKNEVRVQVCEYLDGDIVETLDNGDFIMRMCALVDERMWFAMLMSFGDRVKVMEPEELKTRLMETAENILTLYKE